MNRDAVLFLAALAVPFVVTGIAVWFAEAVERKWRFSLRSLLIATTLLAVALGLAVFVAPK